MKVRHTWSASLLVRALVGAAVVFAALAGCQTHEAARIVRLEVSSSNTYTVNGAPVAREALARVLLLHKREGQQLNVHVVPSQGAQYSAVFAAVEAVQSVGGNIGMVGNEAFYPASQSSAARP
jgi:biopolymer transport protein ExbD